MSRPRMNSTSGSAPSRVISCCARYALLPVMAILSFINSVRRLSMRCNGCQMPYNMLSQSGVPAMKNSPSEQPTKKAALIFLFGLAVVTTSRLASPALERIAFRDDFEAFERAWRAGVFAVIEQVSFHDDF